MKNKMKKKNSFSKEQEKEINKICSNYIKYKKQDEEITREIQKLVEKKKKVEEKKSSTKKELEKKYGFTDISTGKYIIIWKYTEYLDDSKADLKKVPDKYCRHLKVLDKPLYKNQIVTGKIKDGKYGIRISVHKSCTISQITK